jgi:hypothetical protein
MKYRLLISDFTIQKEKSLIDYSLETGTIAVAHSCQSRYQEKIILSLIKQENRYSNFRISIKKNNEINVLDNEINIVPIVGLPPSLKNLGVLDAARYLQEVYSIDRKELRKTDFENLNKWLKLEVFELTEFSRLPLDKKILFTCFVLLKQRAFNIIFFGNIKLKKNKCAYIYEVLQEMAKDFDTSILIVADYFKTEKQIRSLSLNEVKYDKAE